jgi:predicted unusual protein kinase regulating ubiquinone biosynthesis (AarF/ABC1/UbiB family)
MIRFLRAMWLFLVIFVGYFSQWLLSRLLRQRPVDGDYEVPTWLKKRRGRLDTRNARRLLAGMLRLRGVYIKLGQVLSVMGGFLPRAFSKELESLQDQVPPHPFSEIERTIVREFGKRPLELWKSIDPTPLAAASLGQVHVAYDHAGNKLAVKILYPRIRDVIAVDMRVLSIVIRVYSWFVPVNNLMSVHRSLVDLLRRETDYLHEAACMKRMADNFADEDDIIFPEVIADRTTRDVLTMTFMEGVKITRFEDLDKIGADRTQVATRLVQSFYKQLFVNHFFHADPHPGNFLVQPGPKIVVLDFGAISEAASSVIDGALDILQGLMTEDAKLVLKGFHQMGFVSAEGNKELLERTVVTYFSRLLKIRDRTPQALMDAKPEDLERLARPEVEREELRELMKSFVYPEGWFYVERASVMMFWLCAQLDPKLDTMSVGMPYVLPVLMQKKMAEAANA